MHEPVPFLKENSDTKEAVSSDKGMYQDKPSSVPTHIPKADNGDSMLEFYAVELLCGSAGLTACMRTFLPSSFGVDHQVTRPKAKVIKLDLLDSSSQTLVLQWITDPRCVWVHWGVPCGTSSRARNIRMFSRRHGPPPLRRTKQFPNGLPANYVSSLNLLRLRSATRLYRFMMEAILALAPTTIWTIENP